MAFQKNFLGGFGRGRGYNLSIGCVKSSCIESLPSGALQIYVAVVGNNWNKWLETVSIAASLLSVAWGLMTSSSRGIYGDYFKTTAPKWSFLCFCLFDFTVNSLTLAMFISLPIEKQAKNRNESMNQV